MRSSSRLFSSVQVLAVCARQTARYALLGGLLTTGVIGQVDISALTTSDLAALKFAGTQASESNTSSTVTFSSGTTNISTGYYTIVGNTSTAPAFSVGAAQYVTPVSGSTPEAGVIFRLWLGSYAPTYMTSGTNFAVVVGIGPSASPAKANVGVMAVISNSGSTGSVYILDSGKAGSQGANAEGELLSVLGVNTVADPVTLLSTVNPLTSTSFLSYQAVTNVFSGTSGGALADNNDAWLTIAVPFSAINVATTSVARSGSTFGVNSQWNFTAGVFTNVTVPTLTSGTALSGTVRDFFGSSNLGFSDAVTANGTVTTGSFNVASVDNSVPEEATALMLPALLGPVAGIALWRRRAKRAAQAKVAAAN